MLTAASVAKRIAYHLAGWRDVGDIAATHNVIRLVLLDGSAYTITVERMAPE